MKTKKYFMIILWTILFSWIASFLWLSIYINMSANNGVFDYLFFKKIDIMVIILVCTITITIGLKELLPGTNTKNGIRKVNTNMLGIFRILYRREIIVYLISFSIAYILLSGVFNLYSSAIIGKSFFNPNYFRELVLFFEKNGIQCENKGDLTLVVNKLIADTKNADILVRFNNEYFSQFNWFIPAIIIILVVLIPLGFASGYYGENWFLSGILIVPVSFFIKHISFNVPSVTHNIFSLPQKSIIIITSLFIVYIFSYYGYRLRIKSKRCQSAE